MKPLSRSIAIVVAIISLICASAEAARTFTSVTITPALTNITAGVATNLIANVAVRSGSGGSTRFIGTAQVTASVSPAEPTITTTVTGTNFVYPNADTTYNFT